MKSSERSQVLLVDDEYAILDMVSRFVRRLGVDVDCAQSGEEALDLISKKFYHLFIVDLLMRGMDGIQLLEHIKNLSPDSEVIILTGHGDIESVVRALRGGAYDYFQKPVEDVDVLLLTVQAALDKQHLRMDKSRLIEDLRAANQRIERQRVQELQHIREIGSILASSLQRDEIVRAVYSALKTRTGAEVSGFWLGGPAFDTKELVLYSDRPLGPDLPTELSCLIEKELSSFPPDFSRSAEIPLRVIENGVAESGEVITGPLLSSVVVPMKARDQLQGLVVIASTTKNAFSEDDERLLGIFAGQAVIALENEGMFRRMSYLAIRDGLTGLFNHRHFYALLEMECERSERYNHEFSLVMIDADTLKEVNDTHGHLAGDAVLKELSDLLVGATRESDIVARYGGDEFMVILPETSRESAKVLAERLRCMVAEHHFLVDADRVEFTISVGVSVFAPGRGTEIEDLVGSADRALYEAKAAGRNRLCISGDV